jgi:DNA/RNA-binding domain of Phe-tRNA-synthetase-like protein
MRFRHHDELWRDFPGLVPGVIHVEGVTAAADVSAAAARFTDVARSRLTQAPESELAEIQAWRRAFTRMGLRPTQYRCAAESLLRRLRTHGSLPGLHPLVDLCNAVSVAFAIPVAALDVSAIAGDLQVRYAAGDEEYLTFSGETEHPAAGEVIFHDRADRRRGAARVGGGGHRAAHRGDRRRARRHLVGQGGPRHIDRDRAARRLLGAP